MILPRRGHLFLLTRRDGLAKDVERFLDAA